MLSAITPLILTFNEAPNLRRTLEWLRWAQQIIVVDSFRTDETLDIVKTFPQARFPFSYGIPAVARSPKQNP
jgi:glycosyltransferase involved in cell wall biosynthesis